MCLSLFNFNRQPAGQHELKAKITPLRRRIVAFYFIREINALIDVRKNEIGFHCVIKDLVNEKDFL
ncbi:MAG TPA: hypothetical protein DCP36_00070 [Sporomusaceae bacterium]|jgi:hypothetical protein|nr:hypothetical protein [Anaerospora sp.]HAK72349.1 hypothetical protein [Sporomusaceae bacterium]